MTEFFVKTDDSSAGPFTGVELREAALARIINPESEIGASPTGPWTIAKHAGLFSNDRIPLPHPEGTHVPDYAVRGFPGARHRMKLRELIGFAARGMLSPHVTLQSDVSDEWIPVNRLPVLIACLTGQLVVLGESGKVHLRSGHGESDAKPLGEAVHAPVKVAPSSAPAIHTSSESPDALLVGDHGLIVDEEEESSDVTIQDPAGSDLETQDSEEQLDEAAVARRRIGVPRFLRSRLMLNLACLLLLIGGIGVAYSFWTSGGMAQELVIGDWVGGNDEIPTFGISLRKDGTCVVFNSQGESWTGDYTWGERFDPKVSAEGIKSFSSEVEQIDPAFQNGAVLPTDGYLRFQGFIQKRPSIGGHPINDCFLRKEGNNLKLGYVTTVSYSSSEKRMEAGWTELRPLKSNSENIVAELAAIEMEPRSVSERAIGTMPHISEAITNLQDWQEDDLADGDVDNGTLCYTLRVNAEYLIKTFGVPDEARRIYPFEDPELASGPLQNAQIARYGSLSLYLTTDGELQYISLTP